MSVLDGPGEGTWSVFAAKVVAERDEARADLREFVRQVENAYELLKPLEEGSDVVERAVDHLLTVLRGRERPGPWAFDEVLKERDEARAELSALRKRVVEALPYPTDDDSDESRTAEEAIEMAVAERDAAYRSRDLAIKMWDEERAEAERWKRSCNVFRERDWPTAFQATVTRLEREVSDAHDQLAKLRRLSKPWEGDAYRRGAEAMREACAKWFREHDESFELTVDACHDVIADMPIPEDK